MEMPEECDRFYEVEGNDVTDSERDHSEEEAQVHGGHMMESPKEKQERKRMPKHSDIRFSLQKANSHFEFLTRVLEQIKSEQQHFMSFNSLQRNGILERNAHVDSIRNGERLLDTNEAADKDSEEDTLSKPDVEEYIREIEILRSQSSELKKENVRLQCRVEQLEASTMNFGRVRQVKMSIVDGNKVTRDESITTSPTTSLTQQADCVDDYEATLNTFDHIDQSDKKIQELWQTIKSLQVYVELYRTEKEELLRQRDDAMKSTERALEANVKLVGNANPHQKIKYLQSLKNENVLFQKKIRELEIRIRTKDCKICSVCKTQAQKYIRPEARSSVSDSAAQSQDSASQVSSQDENFGKLEKERNELFRKMWTRNKKLQAEVDQLRAKKKAMSLEQSKKMGGRINNRS